MKLFLDRNRTLLPRIDVIYLLTRGLMFVGLLWYLLTYCCLVDADYLLVWVISVTYAIQLALFALAVKEKFDIKLAYLLAILYDIIFLPLYCAHTGYVDSSFFLLFFLTIAVAAYVLTFWFAGLATLIVSVAYVGVLLPGLSVEVLFDIAMRVAFLWVCFLTVSYASDYLRRSERRLMKLFDTLNMRTSELEKSQAQLEMIYENTQILASFLEPDGVVREIMRILDRTLQFEQFAVVFRSHTGELYYRARSVDGRMNYHPKAIPSAGNDLIRRVVEMTEAVTVNDISERNDYIPLRDTTTSVILVPMVSHGNAHGLLVAESKSRGTFSDRDDQLLTVVARSASLALENAELHKRTQEMSIMDDLTGAYNYRYFVRKLQEEKNRAIRYNLPLSLIMVDIDWFKKLNDSYGHEIGNVVLTELAEVIKDCIRDVDVFARYGGEEFVIILPQTPQAEASVLAERIRTEVEKHVVGTENSGSLRVTVSAGVSSFPENGKSAEDLVSTADQALYRAKDSGKNLVCTV